MTLLIIMAFQSCIPAFSLRNYGSFTTQYAAGPKEPTKNPKNRRLHLLLQKKPIQRACASSRTFIQDFVFHATIIHKKTFSERTKKNKNPTFVVAFTFSYCIYLYKVAFTFSFNAGTRFVKSPVTDLYYLSSLEKIMGYNLNLGENVTS